MRRLLLFVFCVLMTTVTSQQLAKRDIPDYIEANKGGVLVKNGLLTSCELAVIDSMASIVAASCLDYAPGTGLDTNTNYEIYIEHDEDSNGKPYKVDQISVHPDYNATTGLNDIAVLQYNKQSQETWHNKFAPKYSKEYDKYTYARKIISDVNNPTWSYDWNSDDRNSDNYCLSMSGVFSANMDGMYCSSATTGLQSKDLFECNIPMGLTYYINDNTSYIIGLYSFTAVSQGNNLCNGDMKQNYYTGLGSYFGFIKDTIGRDFWVKEDGAVDPVYNTSFIMAEQDNNFVDHLNVSRIDGDFFKNQKVDNSDVVESVPESNQLADKPGLSHKMVVIIATCASVGGVIVFVIIALIFWWRIWRRQGISDHVAQTQYQNAIETEIGGATRPTLLPNNETSLVEFIRNSEANIEATRIVSVVHGPDSYSDNGNGADLPPRYNETAEVRQESMLAGNKDGEIKKGGRDN